MPVQYEERPPDGPTMWAYYEGSDVLYTGYALCFNSDYGTAADVDPSRLYRVEKPSLTNYRAFAGVVHPDSNGVTGPKRIRIIRSGPAEIWSNLSNVVDATRLTFVPGQYYFSYAGFPGAGSALALQTIDRSSTAGKCYAMLDSGPQSCGMNIVTAASALTTGGASRIDAGAAIAITLGSALEYGERKFIVMQTATGAATLTVALHVTSDPEVFTFDAVDESLELVWTGTEWATVGTQSATA